MQFFCARHIWRKALLRNLSKYPKSLFNGDRIEAHRRRFEGLQVVRQIPYHTQAELISLAKTVHGQYGETVLLYDYLSSNAYSDVIAKNKNGWFGRSTMFNPTDLSDNAAELVLIDPHTRALLEPSSMPESGEIKPVALKVPGQCSQSLPIQ